MHAVWRQWRAKEARAAERQLILLPADVLGLVLYQLPLARALPEKSVAAAHEKNGWRSVSDSLTS